jgi:hypothetical protein
MKFKQVANKFRILSSLIMGWEYWTESKKPVVSSQSPPNRCINNCFCDVAKKTPALERTFRLGEVRNYFGGDSDFEAEPAGPVVVFGAIAGVPLAPPFSVVPDAPPDDIPVVPDFFTASELVFVIPGLFMSCCPAGPVVWA